MSQNEIIGPYFIKNESVTEQRNKACFDARCVHDFETNRRTTYFNRMVLLFIMQLLCGSTQAKSLQIVG